MMAAAMTTPGGAGARPLAARHTADDALVPSAVRSFARTPSREDSQKPLRITRHHRPVQTLSVLVTDYGIYLIALVAAVVWLMADRPSKVSMAVAGAITLGIVGLLLLLSGAAWFDPRPFVVDGRPPLVPHGPDNGFPSDHTTMAAAIAGVVLAYRRRIGIALLVVAALVGASRVAVHVHHVPDVVGGFALGLLAAALGVWLGRLALQHWDARRSRRSTVEPETAIDATMARSRRP
jgi:undecaprenyl-diphosphatase